MKSEMFARLNRIASASSTAKSLHSASSSKSAAVPQLSPTTIHSTSSASSQHSSSRRRPANMTHGLNRSQRKDAHSSTFTNSPAPRFVASALSLSLALAVTNTHANLLQRRTLRYRKPSVHSQIPSNLRTHSPPRRELRSPEDKMLVSYRYTRAVVAGADGGK